MSANTARGCLWSITINNPVESDEEALNLARQRGWTITGQKEQGAEGTPHYQLMVKTPQVRFSAVKKAFPRAHIEPARNPTALAQYVVKDDTRVGELKEDSAMYPSLSKLWNLLWVYALNEGIFKLHRQWYEPEDTRVTISLAWFDEFINDCIRKGYRVETMGANPQIRSVWKLYSNSILNRERVAAETALATPDRQTDKPESIVVPTLNADETEGSQGSEEEDGSSSSDSEGSFCSGEFNARV